MMKTPETRMTAARTRLLLDFPWFGSLAMRLKIEPSEETETFATDGTRLIYNPAALAKVTDSELTGIVAHEVMHCALLHPFRRAHRDAREWNEATDYAINSELLKCGLTLPADVLNDSQFDGLSADVIFAMRAKQKQQEQQSQEPQPDAGAGKGSPDPNGQPAPSTGTVEDAPPEPNGQPADAPANGSQPDQQQPAPQMSESDWKIAAEQASDVARGCGKLPAGAARAIKDARTEPQDWRAILREFVEHTAPSDYSWMSPNRRHVANGVYLPGMTKENMGAIAIAIDTSGSIDQRVLAMFANELNAIASEAKPSKVTVLYCDSHVQRTDEFEPEEEIKLNAKGGGGTRFQPIFDAIAARVETGEEPPACLIYFTDLDCYDQPAEPDYPVLWCTELSVTKTAPFGQTVRITA